MIAVGEGKRRLWIDGLAMFRVAGGWEDGYAHVRGEAVDWILRAQPRPDDVGSELGPPSVRKGELACLEIYGQFNIIQPLGHG